MEMGLGATVFSACNGSVLIAGASVDMVRAAPTSFLRDRKVQRSNRSLDQIHTTSVTQCSTSGFGQVSVGSSSFHQRPRRRGKCGRATRRVEPLVDYGSVIVPVECEENEEEVVLWLARSNRQSRDRPVDSDNDILAQNSLSISQEIRQENDTPGSNECNVEGGTDRFSGTENCGNDLIGTSLIQRNGVSVSLDSSEDGETSKSREGGWRGLGLDAAGETRKSGIPKAFLLKKPKRNVRTVKREEVSDIPTFPSPDVSKRDETEQELTSASGVGETYLKDSLFRSLASPQSGIDRATAVEKYFGDELRGTSGVVNSSPRSDNLEIEGAGGWAGISRSPAVSEGGDRLKINLDLELYRARTLRQKGKMIEAEAILSKCIRNWPDDGRPYVALGRLLVKQNKVQEARAAYERGCQAVRGENAYIWQAWAILEERAGNLAKARQLFDAATVADKKHAAAWHGWAKLELRADNVKRARSLLNKGLKFCGANEYLLQTLALIESRAGKLEQARSLLARATQHNPKSAASWLAWALMESQNGLHETARRLFQKGIVASPKNRYVWQAWALFEARQGNKERARELFQRGHELNPKDAVLLQAFALFEYECGRTGLARDYFRRALVCDSSHQPVWIAWGWMEWKQGNIGVARELYQGAIQADSRSMDAARAFQAWGVLEDREGDSGLARELFKCALKIDSQSVPTWMSWAAMEEREGRSVRADEIRNLFLQQRTEVVDEVPWDVDLSDMLAPAIDKIKGFFRVNQRPSERNDGSSDFEDRGTEGLNLAGGTTGMDSQSFVNDEEFDVERFLREKFPWKYGSRDLLKSTAVLEAIDRSLKRQSRDTGREERLDIFMNNEGPRKWK
ncbi:hypothetical protein MPTK1_5g00100 [Marchantia polymorpha subsp. ruderalis]|uniref:Uncharacterized protein n=2 Tax=Marchantia polymorpha TaxID=3197 RepID=A0A176WS35_MARPO|nr:hypothetical protein AXG93_1278s1120 [Marchantia polymorpha subsp. ruderalis]PTQ34587.1 hypothetical protein MARPO_0078s0010 [Marchantia polymorpha]BBN09994.1 hypothetical protein Mp_5g00100 [Marchantia polymorpha subsp. ruderalis]|eukprot:PTQ34587.1 hypothetical protein MARPO_0078s0010 [Marchantia polymorpha]